MSREMSKLVSDLPSAVQAACRDLREGLLRVLGDDLVWLWVYGAVTFDDRPRRLGDVDTHAIVRSPSGPARARAIDDLHASSDVEWDSWYVLLADAASRAPPRHAFRAGLHDRAWALHRAHWLAGQYVLLHGRAPAELVPAPTWPELLDGLRSEVEFVEGVVREGPRDAEHAAFAVWNGCRVVYSLRTRDVVVSKRAAATWALEHAPSSWRPAIEAAGRAYDAQPRPGDAETLRAAAGIVAAAARDALG